MYFNKEGIVCIITMIYKHSEIRYDQYTRAMRYSTLTQHKQPAEADEILYIGNDISPNCVVNCIINQLSLLVAYMDVTETPWLG